MKNKSLEEKFLEEFKHCANLEYSNKGFIFEAGYELAQKESEEKIKKLREALEFYANEDHWDLDQIVEREKDGYGSDSCCGMIARKVLKEIE